MVNEISSLEQLVPEGVVLPKLAAPERGRWPELSAAPVLRNDA